MTGHSIDRRGTIVQSSRSTSVVVCIAGLLFALHAQPAAAGSAVRPDRPERTVEPSRARARAVALEPGAGSPAARAAERFLARHGGTWLFRADPRTGKLELAQGSGLPFVPGRGNRLDAAALAGAPRPDGQLTVEALEPRVREFIAANAELLLPERGELVLDRATSLIRDGGKLATLRFAWHVDGLAVDGAEVFVRINSGNITQFGAPLVGPIDLDTTPVLDRVRAFQAALDHAGHSDAARAEEAPELIILPEEDPGQRLAHRLVWRLRWEMPGELESWEALVDARSGEIVAFGDRNRHAGRVVGGVFKRTVHNESEVLAPFPKIDVDVEGTAVAADTAGAYPYAGGKATATLGGTGIRTLCSGCSSPPQPRATIELGTGRIDFGFGGIDTVGNGLSTRAGRTAFFHLSQVHRVALGWLPGLPWLQQPLTNNVNIDASCNASYDPGANAVNFYRSSMTCNNTGEVSDVVHHEWGHGIDIGSGGGDMGEGTADVTAMHMSRSPLVGPGFNLNGNPVRNLDQETNGYGIVTLGNYASRCGTGVHCHGQIYGQTAWELAQALSAKHGHHTGWRTSERLFYLSLPDAGGTHSADPPATPIFDAYVNADDDDGNLANGTPNGAEISVAFADHEIAGPALPSSPGCLRPGQPAVDVLADCDTFELSWNAIPGASEYRVLRAELRPDTAYVPLASLPAGQTTHTDTEVAPGVDYWYVVMAVDGAGCESPVESPEHARLPAQPILGISAALADDEPAGNRSGFPDPGEDVDLVITVDNHGELDATSVSGTVVPLTPGVSMLSDQVSWSAIPAGGAVETETTLRFTSDAEAVTCGQELRFRFDPVESTSCSGAASYFSVVLGERVGVLEDVFEADSGWGADLGATTATTGSWVRGEPRGTSYQPSIDVTPSGTSCWYTGPNPTGNAGQDDVDDGVAVLLSPVYDLSGQTGLELGYWRWFADSEPGADAGDFFRVEISNDGGSGFTPVEELGSGAAAGGWIERRVEVDPLIALTSEMRLRVSVADGLADGAIVEGAIDDVRFVKPTCDATPACFVEPTFSGLASAAPGDSCAETSLAWSAAESNCINAEITYNVYRSTEPGFTPGPASLLVEGLFATAFEDALLEPGQTYHYAVRAFDSRSGEDSNAVVHAVASPVTPDVAAPVFAGLAGATTGAGCGEVALAWAPAAETCNAPVTYRIYRSTDPGFTPGPATLVGSSLSTSFVDAALAPDEAYTYVVRARDGAGNESPTDVRLTAGAGITDLVRAKTEFEADAGGWAAVSIPSSMAGQWGWGDPDETAFQPEDDATPDGTKCWFTGLTTGGGNGSNDVDDGETILRSAVYDLTGAVNPAVRYARWYTNDRGQNPGEDPFVIEVSNNSGATWAPLEQVASPGGGLLLPLAWVDVEIPLGGILPVTSTMRFRFTAEDAVGSGSLIEAGIDDFELVDLDQGCLVCTGSPGTVGTILVRREGDDVIVDWTGDPAPGARFAVYQVSGADFSQAVRIGTTTERSFVHEGAALSPEPFGYRVSALDECGNESGLQ